MKKTWKKLMALLCVSAMLLSGLSAFAADDDFDVSGSKTASPTELACPDRQTEVTLQLPAGEYQNKVDIVFVMDNSSSTTNAGLNFAENAESLFGEIVKNNPGIDLKVGVVKFRGYATDMLENGLKEYNDSTKDTIIAAIKNSTVPGSGSNAHSGLIMADQLLTADTEVDDDHKYVIFLTDGKNYIWNNEDNEPMTYYAHYLRGNAVIQDDGYPVLNQYSGIYNKELGSTYNVFASITDHTPFCFYVSGSSDGSSSVYYKKLFDSDLAEIKATNTKYDFPCYYTKFYPEGSYNGYASSGHGTATNHGTVVAYNIENSNVAPDLKFYKTYYEFTPAEGTFWENVNYLQAYPYEVYLNADDGKYYYDTDKVNEDFYLWHPSNMEKGAYQVGHYWTDVINAKYNAAGISALASGSGTAICNSFSWWLLENSDYGAWYTESDQVAELFTNIDNSIRYMVSKGVVTDEIADPFTLVNSDKLEGFKMTLNGEALTGVFEDGKWTFADGAYEVTLDDAKKVITWNINVPIENLKPVTLTYTLELPEDAVTGKYPTNASAILEYTSSDGKKDGTFEFEKPEVNYFACVEVNVVKIWDDNDNEAEKRPEKVEVVLMNDDKELMSLTLSEDNDWTGTFAHTDNVHIPENILDNLSVKEVSVDGYTCDITGNAEDGFTITNTYVPPTTEEETTEAETTEEESTAEETTPETGDSMNLLPFAMTLVLAGAAFVVLSRTGKQDER